MTTTTAATPATTTTTTTATITTTTTTTIHRYHDYLIQVSSTDEAATHSIGNTSSHQPFPYYGHYDRTMDA